MKILKKGLVKTKKCICNSCNTELEYSKKDTYKFCKETEWDEQHEEYDFIIINVICCPVCEEKITIP